MIVDAIYQSFDKEPEGNSSNRKEIGRDEGHDMGRPELAGACELETAETVL